MTGYNRALRKFVSPEFITGDDARLFAGRYALNFNLKRVLVVTDKNIENCPWYSSVIGSISDSNIEYDTFTSVSENPTVDEVMEGASLYKGEDCDGIIAVGGGSVLDCAKGIGIVAENGGHISEYVGLDLIRNPMPPLICVPSTSGSSADVSQYAVISDRVKRTKKLIVSKSLVPDVSLLDTVPLSTLESGIAVNSAMDAFIHAIEGYCSNGSSPVTDTFALNSIDLIKENMCQEYWKDEERCFGVMLASLYAGLSFSNAGLGLIHSISHSIGGWSGVNHGLASFLVTSEVMRFNIGASPRKYRDIASRLGYESSAGSDSNSKVVDYIDETVMDLFGFDRRPKLSDFGLGSSDIQPIKERTMLDPCIATNPRMPSEEDVERILINIL